MILRACPKCGRRTSRRYCNQHEAAENRRRYNKARGNGLHTPHWDRVRAARLRFAAYICEFRFDGCSLRATTVHIPPHLGGDHSRATLENTRAACAHCHGVIDAPRAQGGE